MEEIQNEKLQYLYKRDTGLNEYIKERLLANFNKQVTQWDKDCFENQITDEEMDEDLEGLKINKSPGLDGLTKEFYARFWKLLRPILFLLYKGYHNLLET